MNNSALKANYVEANLRTSNKESVRHINVYNLTISDHLQEIGKQKEWPRVGICNCL